MIGEGPYLINSLLLFDVRSLLSKNFIFLAFTSVTQLSMEALKFNYNGVYYSRKSPYKKYRQKSDTLWDITEYDWFFKQIRAVFAHDSMGASKLIKISLKLEILAEKFSIFPKTLISSFRQEINLKRKVYIRKDFFFIFLSSCSNFL